MSPIPHTAYEGHQDQHPHRERRTNANRGDPTQTIGIRESYGSEAYTRFRSLKGVVRETVSENDALRLGDPRRRGGTRPADQLRVNAPIPRGRANARARDAFRFESRADKEQAFMDWFQGALNRDFLEPVGAEQVKRGGHWSAAYVRAASKRGVKDAQQNLQRAGIEASEEALDAAFNAPVHQDLARSLYQRNFRALQGITDAVDGEVSRILTEGLIEGINPSEMASRMTDRIDKIGITRARTLARTEVVRAYNSHALTRYETLGVESVTAKVEWLTAGDQRVCAQCRAMGGSTYTIDEARGKLPQHPSCRCAWSPIINT